MTIQEKELVIARLEAMSEDLHFSSGNSVAVSRDEMIELIKNENEVGRDFVKMQLDFIRALKDGSLMKVLVS